MTADDNFCTPATVMHRWVDIPFEVLMESQLHQKWHRNAEAERKRLEHGKNMIGEANLPGLSQYTGFICYPLSDGENNTRLQIHAGKNRQA